MSMKATLKEMRDAVAEHTAERSAHIASNLTDATRAAVLSMTASGSGRYFLVRENDEGKFELDRLNSYGKAISWAFKQRAAAFAHAERRGADVVTSYDIARAS